MNDADRYAFIDESGNSDTNAGRMLVISAVVPANNILLSRTLKSAEKKNRSIVKKNYGEMKAAAQLPEIRKRVLTHILKCDFSVYSLIYDLMTISNTPYKYDEIYSVGMSMLCSQIYAVNPGICFVLDKRYTKEALRDSLSRDIRDMISCQCHINADDIEIKHSDSIEYAELRDADYVVYETYQKYKFGSEIYDIIADRVKKVMFYHNTTWGEIKKESKTPQN